MINESVSILSEIAILVQILSETAPNIFSAFDANLCTQIKFDFPTRTWMDKTAFVTNDFEKKWSKKECFPTVFVLYRDFVSESSQKIGPLWDNYEGLAPKQPYQPEFVILNIRKYKNDSIRMNSVGIHSNNLEYPQDWSVAKLREFWFICNDNSDFMLATVNQADIICKQINSTIKTYYSKNDMIRLMTRVIFVP